MLAAIQSWRKTYLALANSTHCHQHLASYKPLFPVTSTQVAVQPPSLHTAPQSPNAPVRSRSTARRLAPARSSSSRPRKSPVLGAVILLPRAVVPSHNCAGWRLYTASEDDYLLTQDVAADRLGLGFFGYAYYAEYADQLRAVAIDNGQGCVAPTVETIVDGSYQPLSRPIFIYVRADSLNRPEIAAFVRFYVQNGAMFAEQALYVPLPETVYQLALQRVERRITGSVFSGGSQVGLSIEQLLQLEDR